ncbi:MAG: 30S ribosomal protein S17 [Parcubacteria group bacterium]|jgi:small subunit ribosomal protein S17
MTQEKKKMILKGTVVSDAMDKTIVVAVDTFKTHKKYLKKYISTKKYKVHDPENAYKIGDVVKIVPGRPMSKDKKFVVVI